MCGIFGYIGPKNGVDIVLKGLKRLEYRGYDSAGIAGVSDGKILFSKEVGKLSILEAEVHKAGWQSHTTIGHTRWSTHGVPSKINAHPHFDEDHTVAIVHNGIIENHAALRQILIKEGVKFITETDSEVVAHLIAHHYKGDFLKAVQATVPLLKGAFAIAALHQDHPDMIIAFANQAPIAVGLGSGEAFIASDPHAFSSHSREAIFLDKFEIAAIKQDVVEIYDAAMKSVEKTPEYLNVIAEERSKGNYEHYTLKEIHEQPQTIRNAMADRFLEDYGTAIFEDNNCNWDELFGVERVLILACGTSWHAGLVGGYMIEDRARIPVQVEISSEFRYKNPIILPDTCVIAISQSGETADTLAAVREVQGKGGKILAICNSQSSSLTREADATIYLRAGPEIGVCSTKAYTSQVTVLAMLMVQLARRRHMSKLDGQAFLHALKDLPNQVQGVLDQEKKIAKIAKKYAEYQNFFFIGRRYMYPSSLEGALKLKEISYINANGYPAGEMKHGPIALLSDQCPVVALCANKSTSEKMHSNLMEVKSRSAPLIAIAEEGTKEIEGIADDIIWVPGTIDELATIPTVVATQLLAYYIAKERGADIDQPRNLAKSVTVE